MNIIEENHFVKGWKSIVQEIPRPKKILCVSAHWYNYGEEVSRTIKPETIHDFYGFPQELYEIEYSAPGAPDLADRVKVVLGDSLRINTQRGLDHGVWSVLKYMYPQADIPVCQLSVNALFSPGEMYETGRRLQVLRNEGVLIIGSGNIVHNLALVRWGESKGYPWADDFDEYIKAAMLAGRHDLVMNYYRAGLSAEKAVYYHDHFDPLLYVLGATDAHEPVQVFNNERVMGSVSMTSYVIGA